MAITIKHAKTDTIADWTQTDLDAQIALGNFPAGTVLADIVLPSDWNNDHTISGTVPIANGGTGQATATAAINALLPSQSSQSGKVLSTDGTNTSWIAAGGTGTVTSVTGTAPVSVATGTTTPVISMAAATSSVDGYLTSTDWTTFNSKAPATSGTSILYGNGSGGFSNVTVGSGLSFSTGTLSATGSSMVYPGAGIPNSTGSAWGTSYTTSGTGDVVLTTGATQANPTISNYENFTPITAPTYTEGRVWYDSTEKALAFYNDSSALAVHVGQDLIVKVINNTGSTIANGSPVYVTGTSSGQTYPNIALAKADVAATSAVIGLTNGSIANGATGYVTSQGTIDNVNTSSFTVGQVLYLSPYSAGQLMNTIPPTGITVQVGVVTFVNSSTGHIYVKQTTPLAVPASIITGQVALANGGTNANLTAVNGGAVYSTGSALAITAAGTSGQVLTSNGASAPTWTTPAAGTVTSVSVVSANGLAGTSSGGATPALTLSTTVTGLLKGNGTAISAATSGTDYAPATSGSSILYGDGSGGFSNVTVGTGLSFSAGTLSATSSGGVTSFQTSLSGLTPSTASTGVVTLAGTLGISSGGTGQTTANAAFNALAPSQATHTGQYLKTDGTDTSWASISTYFPIYTHAGTNSNIPIANGYFTITNHAGSTINIPVY